MGGEVIMCCSGLLPGPSGFVTSERPCLLERTQHQESKHALIPRLPAIFLHHFFYTCGAAVMWTLPAVRRWAAPRSLPFGSALSARGLARALIGSRPKPIDTQSWRQWSQSLKCLLASGFSWMLYRPGTPGLLQVGARPQAHWPAA